MSSGDAKIIIKHFDDKFAQLLESMDTHISETVRPIIQEELAELKDNMKIVKATVRDTNKDVFDHEQRITKLETA